MPGATKYQSKQVQMEKRFKDIDYFGNVRDWVYVKLLPRLTFHPIKCDKCSHLGFSKHSPEFAISFAEQFYGLLLVSACEEQAYPRGTKLKNGNTLLGAHKTAKLVRDIAATIEKLDGKFTPEDLDREWTILYKRHGLDKRGEPKMKVVIE